MSSNIKLTAKNVRDPKSQPALSMGFQIRQTKQSIGLLHGLNRVLIELAGIAPELRGTKSIKIENVHYLGRALRNIETSSDNHSATNSSHNFNGCSEAAAAFTEARLSNQPEAPNLNWNQLAISLLR